MLGSVLATLYESLMVPMPTMPTSMIWRRNPVIRLVAVAITIEPLALASDGSLRRSVMTGISSVLGSGRGIHWVASAIGGRRGGICRPRGGKGGPGGGEADTGGGTNCRGGPGGGGPGGGPPR